MILENFPHRLAVSCRAGNVRDILEYYGHQMNESLLFGLSNSLSFAYVLPDETHEVTEFAMISGNSHNGFEELACTLRMHYASWVPQKPEDAWPHIARLLQEGRPVLLDVVLAMYMKYLETSALPGGENEQLRQASESEKEQFVSAWDRMFSRLTTPAGTHVTMLVGMDEEKNEAYLVENNLSRIQTVPLDVLKEACYPKVPTTKHPNGRYSVYYIPEKFPPIERCIKYAIAANAHTMLYGSRKQNGIKAIDRLAHDLPNWPDMMPLTTVKNSMNMMYYVSEMASGGGFYRRLYANFLKEAHSILGDDRLADASKRYFSIARKWRELNLLLSNGSERPVETLRSDAVRDLALEIAKAERDALLLLESIAKSWETVNV
jgi:hypothetical protein